MAAMQKVAHHGEGQGDGKTVYRVHFLSQLDDSRCESVDILAHRLERVDQRTANADGVMIEFQSGITAIVTVEQQ